MQSSSSSGRDQGLTEISILSPSVASLLPGFVYQLLRKPDGTEIFTHVSEGLITHFGLQPSLFLTQAETYRHLIHPSDQEQVLASLHLPQPNDLPYSAEYRLVLPRGVRWVRHTARMESTPDHQTRWTGFVTDITASMELEDALLRSEQRFSKVWKSSAIGMLFCSLDGHFFQVNDALCHFLGLREGDILGRHFLDFAHPDDTDEDRAIVGQFLSGEVTSFAREKRYRHAEGHYVWGFLTASVVHGPGGVPLHFVGQVQDVDQRRRAEDELKVSEERISLAARAGQVGMWDYDYLSHEIIWNETQYAIHGYTPENYQPSLFSNNGLLHPADHQKVRDVFAEALKREDNQYEVECRIIRPDGEIRTTRSNALILRDDRGDPIRIVGTEVDITEEKQLLKNLAAARAAAETAAQAKSEFLARMSHEIRTPMNAIMAPAQLLAEHDLSPSQHDLVQMIVSSGEHLLQVINDILDFSKLEARKMRLAQTSFSLAILVHDATRLMALQAQQKGLLFLTQISPGLPDLWSGDANRIRQLLFNFLSNAIKFTEHGQVALLIRRDGRYLRFEVTDIGPGISGVERQRLFRPFEQLREGRLDFQKGTGLGLAICRELVQLMGGRIQVDSIPGQGSSFSFLLPLAEASAPADSPDTDGSARPSLSRPHSILVAEDNASNRHVISMLLKRLGHDPTLVTNGQEALAAVQSRAFDLILMDFEMPVMDGITATRRIREISTNDRHLPIVAVTAHVSTDYQKQCQAAGMDDLLAKPIQLKDLEAMLSKWLPQFSSTA